jgi:hypothetical protein
MDDIWYSCSGTEEDRRMEGHFGREAAEADARKRHWDIVVRQVGEVLEFCWLGDEAPFHAEVTTYID